MPLSDLIRALEAATGPSRELDAEISTLLFGLRIWKPHGCDHFVSEHSAPIPCDPPAYTRSLDAITGAIKERWSKPEIIATEDDGYSDGYSRAEINLSPEMNALAELHGLLGGLPLALSLAAARLAAREAGDAET